MVKMIMMIVINMVMMMMMIIIIIIIMIVALVTKNSHGAAKTPHWVDIQVPTLPCIIRFCKSHHHHHHRYHYDCHGIAMMVTFSNVIVYIFVLTFSGRLAAVESYPDQLQT